MNQEFSAVADLIDRKKKLHRIMVGEDMSRIAALDTPIILHAKDKVFVGFGEMGNFPRGVFQLVEVADTDEAAPTPDTVKMADEREHARLSQVFDEMVAYLEGDGFNNAPEVTAIALELDSGLAADPGLVKASVKAFMLRTLNHLRTQVLNNGTASAEDDS